MRRPLVNPMSDRADKRIMGEMDASSVCSEEGSSSGFPMSSDQMAGIIHRAFLTAYLLVGNFNQAEEATIQGINLWDAASGKEALFDKVLTVAVEMLMASSTADSGEAIAGLDFCLQPEFANVLNLPQSPRSCYVLRVLAGIPAESCGRLLALQPAVVNKLAVIAITALSSSQKLSETGKERTITMDRIDHKEVEALAYRLWQARGYPLGSPDEDWFGAEQELGRASHSAEIPY